MMESSSRNSGGASGANDGARSDVERLCHVAAPVRVELPHQEPVQKTLTISIDRISRGLSKSVRVQLTDPQDLLFLYLVSIAEPDFPKLRESQSLNVDFNGFAHMLVSLVDRCVSTENQQHSNNLFIDLRLDGSAHSSAEDVLRIVERTVFKNSELARLSIRCGNDRQKLEYLSGLALEYRERSDSLLVSQQTTHDRLTEVEQALEQLRIETERRQHGFDMEMRTLLNEHQKELNNVREEFLSQKEALIRKYEDEKRDMERSFRVESETVNRRVADLQSQVAELLSTKTDVVSVSEDRKIQLDHLQRQVQSLTKEAEQLRKIKDDLFEQNAQLERLVQEMKVEQSGLRAEIKGLEHNAATLHALLETASQQRAATEETLQTVKESFKDKDEKLRNAVGEIHKANEIIKTKNAEIKRLEQKAQRKTEVCALQEQKISALSSKADETASERDSVRQEMAKKVEEAAKLKSQIKTLSDELATSAQKIDELQNTVRFLNKGLNEQQMTYAMAGSGGGRVSTSLTDYSGTSFQQQKLANDSAVESFTFTPPSRPAGDGVASYAQQHLPYRPPQDFAKLSEMYLGSTNNSSMAPDDVGSAHRDYLFSSRKVLTSQ